MNQVTLENAEIQQRREWRKLITTPGWDKIVSHVEKMQNDLIQQTLSAGNENSDTVYSLSGRVFGIRDVINYFRKIENEAHAHNNIQSAT